MKKIILILTFVVTQIVVFGSESNFSNKLARQTNTLDSLSVIYSYLSELESNHNFNQTIDNLNKIEFSLMGLEIDSLNALLFHKKGSVYRKNGNLDLAEENIVKAENLYSKISDKKKLAHVIFIKSKIYLSNLDFKTALDLCWQALEIAEELNDKAEQAKAFVQIGIIYDYQDEFDKAILYYQKALTLYIGLENKLGMANSYNNLGVMYDIKGENDEALNYYEKSLALETELKNNIGIAGSKVNIGLIYQNLEKYTLAENLFNEALEIYISENDPFGLGICYSNIAELNVLIGNNNIALEYIEKSIALAEKTNDMMKLIEASESKVNILSKMKRFEEALASKNYVVELRDSILNTNEENRLVRLENQLDGLQKDKKKNKLEKEKLNIKLQNEIDHNNQFLLVLISLLFVSISYIIYMKLIKKN